MNAFPIVETTPEIQLSLVQLYAYLTLLKKTLTRYPLQYSDYLLLNQLPGSSDISFEALRQWAWNAQFRVEQEILNQPSLRNFGLDWPSEAETMIGLCRLDNLHYCVADVLHRNVPGDFIETGVWRGGACILMRALLGVCGETKRKVWLADSFQGLPKPDAEAFPADLGDQFWTYSELAISLDTVKANLRRYGWLDQQVCFLPGWFRDTLPNAPIERLAVLRLDGDMYESTIVALRALYGKISPGGYVIVDDYSGIPSCRSAVDDFRREAGISAPIIPIDWTGIYWQVTTQ
jgi:O-methyltransferase